MLWSSHATTINICIKKPQEMFGKEGVLLSTAGCWNMASFDFQVSSESSSVYIALDES